MLLDIHSSSLTISIFNPLCGFMNFVFWLEFKRHGFSLHNVFTAYLSILDTFTVIIKSNLWLWLPNDPCCFREDTDLCFILKGIFSPLNPSMGATKIGSKFKGHLCYVYSIKKRGVTMVCTFCLHYDVPCLPRCPSLFISSLPLPSWGKWA